MYKNKPINQVSEAVCREYWKWDAVFSVHSQYWLTLVIYVLELITVHFYTSPSYSFIGRKMSQISDIFTSGKLRISRTIVLASDPLN